MQPPIVRLEVGISSTVDVELCRWQITANSFPPNHPGAARVVIRSDNDYLLPAALLNAPDQRLRFLLRRVYVGSGFTKIRSAGDGASVFFLQVLPRNRWHCLPPIRLCGDTQ